MNAITLYPLPEAFARAHFSSAPGGVSIPANYKASKQGDGNFCIHDIDVFRATTRQNPKTGAVNKFDESWMAQAEAKFEENRVRGYLPPVHIDHHDNTGASRRFAGNIGNLRVTHNDDGVAEFRADLVNIPPDVMSEIANKRLPFRSIEVNNPDVPEVSSLALMATVVPYHKLPLTHVEIEGGEQFREVAEAVLFGEDHEGGTVIVQRWGARYEPMDTPIHFKTYTGQRQGDDENENRPGPRQRFGNDQEEEKTQNGLDESESMPDTEDGGTDDLAEYLSPEELEAMLAPGGYDAEGADGLDGFEGYEPDESELAELEGEGIDMAGIADAIGQLANGLNQVAEGQKQVLAKLDTQGAGAPSPSSTPPPAGYKENTDNRETFAEGNVTISASQYHAMVGKMEAMETKVAELVKFQEDVQAGWAQAQWEDAVDGDIRGHLQRLGFAETDAKAAYKHAWNFAEAELARGKDKPDMAQFFSDWSSGSTPPPPPNADDVQAPGPAPKVTEQQAVKFCESSSDIKNAFSLAKKPIGGEEALKAYEAAMTFKDENLAAEGCTLYGQVFGAIHG